jgi:AraC-like DNA-binding protein
MHRTLGSGKYVERTRDYIERTLSYEVPTIADVANFLGLSKRSLQRRLADDRTSFSMLLDDCRRTRAFEMSGDKGEPRRNLHQELGYSQPSGLSRAIRRWKGQPDIRSNESLNREPGERPARQEAPRRSPKRRMTPGP